MAATVTDATASRNLPENHCPLIGRFATLAVVVPKYITTTPKPTSRLGFSQPLLQRTLRSGMSAQMAHLIRLLKGRGRGAPGTATLLHPRTRRSPYPLRICRLMTGTIGPKRLRRQVAVSNTPSRRNPFLLIAVLLSACPPPKTAGMHTDPRQNQHERAPAGVHPLRMPHPLKIDGKKRDVSPVPAHLAWIRTSRPRIALTRRHMTNAIPLGLRQTVRC
jgi:hypothetical protein